MRQYIGGGTWPASLIMSVNHGTAGASTNGIEFSDWAVAAAVIYSCNLNAAQIQQVRLLQYLLSVAAPAFRHHCHAEAGVRDDDWSPGWQDLWLQPVLCRHHGANVHIRERLLACITVKCSSALAGQPQQHPGLMAGLVPGTVTLLLSC